ncbi:Hvo_1808 family surface protein [Salinibaculum rarum]|uniref:Hvo_1808 family surface protein n=1 Tax=Salinibaculum rarum TaxID=3058903 RepID=UPI00265E969A|nr:Hvo_1808 family surface protein [Salinibaculum sp. KK48]
MRRAALLVAACLLLAGCSGFVPPENGTAGTAETNGTTDAPAEMPETNDTTDESGDIAHTERADPDSDTLGWEDGYWHDDPIDVTTSDGLNATERDRAISRAMARVEVIRGLEFEESVDVSVVSRGNYSSGDSSNESEAFRRFDNAKFEALYLIGTQNDSLAEQEATRDQAVAGFYSPGRGDIVLISESDTPQFDGERTLAHELVHALQDQHFNLSNSGVETRDAYNGRNGLIEGDARAVEQAYLDRCGEGWSCLPAEQTASDGSTGESSGSDIHLGVYILEYFPYSDGVGFVRSLRAGGDWSAVNDAFDAPPSSARAVIYPAEYGQFQPRAIGLTDRTSDGWERVRPPTRTDTATLGQSALTAMFAYTLYDDYNRSSVVGPRTFLNLDSTGSVNMTDPFNYDLPATRGWAGDRLHVYQRGDESGYVWRLGWDSPTDAQRFADSYERLLTHWGGSQQPAGHWELAADSPFTDAVDVTVDGDTVTIVNGPDAESLDAIYGADG